MIRALNDMLYSAQLNAGELHAVTQGMSDGEKSRFLWSMTSFPKPQIGRNGRIEVPDPAGAPHYIEHRVIESTEPQFLGGKMRRDDEFECLQHHVCWAIHSAVRAYRINSGLHYEANTGDSFHSIRMVEPLD